MIWKEAIEAGVNESINSSNNTLKFILAKDPEIMRADIKSELSKTIYIVGLVQFLAIVGSIIGRLAFRKR